jgi:hypothetical protein
MSDHAIYIDGPKSKDDGRFQVGQTWRTRGGWTAKIVWIGPHPKNAYQPPPQLYVVHKPGEGSMEESGPVAHDLGGKPLPTFAVCMAPDYGAHPADLIELVTT